MYDIYVKAVGCNIVNCIFVILFFHKLLCQGSKWKASLGLIFTGESLCFFRWMPVWRHELRALQYSLLELAVRSPHRSLYPSPIDHHPPMSCMPKITPPLTVFETPWSKSSVKVRISSSSISFGMFRKHRNMTLN